MSCLRFAIIFRPRIIICNHYRFIIEVLYNILLLLALEPIILNKVD